MKSRVIFKGGLGDILLQLHHCDLFAQLDRMNDVDQVQIVFISHCRGIGELFDRHPRRRQLEIVDLEYVEPFVDSMMDDCGILPLMQFSHTFHEIPHYLSDKDRATLSTLPSKYVVFSLASSSIERNIPLAIAEAAAEIFRKAGLHVVLTGRTYEPWHTWGAIRWKGNRSEVVIQGDGITNAIDVLSLPGCLAAIKGSKGVFCSLSAMQLAAWLYDRKSYVLGNKIFAHVFDLIRNWTMGGHSYSNGHARLRFIEEWNPEDLTDFSREISK